MQPFTCTYEQLQRMQRTQHRPIVPQIISLPLDRHYAVQVQVGCVMLKVNACLLGIVYIVITV